MGLYKEITSSFSRSFKKAMSSVLIPRMLYTDTSIAKLIKKNLVIQSHVKNNKLSEKIEILMWMSMLDSKNDLIIIDVCNFNPCSIWFFSV